MIALPFRRLAAIGAVAASSLAVAAASPVFGPPWISIETPPNPFDATSRGAFLVVHTYHHGDVVASGVNGSAEGIEQEKHANASFRALAHHVGESIGDLAWLAVVHLQRDRHLRAGEVREQPLVRAVAVETELDVIPARELRSGQQLDRRRELLIVRPRQVTIAIHAGDIGDRRSARQIAKPDERQREQDKQRGGREGPQNGLHVQRTPGAWKGGSRSRHLQVWSRA